MAIARINEFHAAPGNGDVLHDLLASFVGEIAAIDGCLAASVLRSQDDTETTVIYEVWESVAHHQAAAREIPAESVQSAIELLSRPPRGEYFDVT